MRSQKDMRLTRAQEEIFDAVRFLAPDEAERLLRELADAMKPLADRYDRDLQSVILS